MLFIDNTIFIILVYFIKRNFNIFSIFKDFIVLLEKYYNI